MEKKLRPMIKGCSRRPMYVRNMLSYPKMRHKCTDKPMHAPPSRCHAPVQPTQAARLLSLKEKSRVAQNGANDVLRVSLDTRQVGISSHEFRVVRGPDEMLPSKPSS